MEVTDEKFKALLNVPNDLCEKDSETRIHAAGQLKGVKSQRKGHESTKFAKQSNQTYAPLPSLVRSHCYPQGR